MIARPGRERRLRSLLRTSPVVAILGAHQSGKTALARSLLRRAALLELDLLVVRGGTRLGFEMKRTVTPQLTRSMHVALGDLGLARLDVVHAGDRTFPLGHSARTVALNRVLEDLDPLR